MALRTRHTTREQPRVTPERRGHPLFWLLILVALLAIGWSVYNRNAAHATPAQTHAAGTTTHASRPLNRSVEAQPVRPARSSRSPRP